MFDEIDALSKKIGIDLFAIVAIFYSGFLLFYFVDISDSFIFFGRIYAWLNNGTVHTLGIVSILLTLIGVLRSSKNRKDFLLKISLFFNSNLSLVDHNNDALNEDDVQKELIEFAKDGREICIIGGNLDYLRKDQPLPKNQFYGIKIFGPKCKILFSSNYKINIEDLRELHISGVQLKIYPRDKSNYVLRGIIKRNDFGIQPKLYLKKDKLFIMQNIQSQYIAEMLYREYNDIFALGRNPFIKYIMFDVGSIWCSGTMQSFYNKIKQITEFEIYDKPENYLLLSERLNLDKNYDICNFISDELKIDLSKKQKNDIKSAWSNNWQLNSKVKSLAIELEKKGYTIIIHSNCDEYNGGNYQLKNYFNNFRLFLLYQMNLLKPQKEFFDHMLLTLNCKPYECLFIDSSFASISKAKELGFYTKTISAFQTEDEKVLELKFSLEELYIS